MMPLHSAALFHVSLITQMPTWDHLDELQLNNGIDTATSLLLRVYVRE